MSRFFAFGGHFRDRDCEPRRRCDDRHDDRRHCRSTKRDRNCHPHRSHCD